VSDPELDFKLRKISKKITGTNILILSLPGNRFSLKSTVLKGHEISLNLLNGGKVNI
jgi:hypothetical protein